MEWHKDLVIDSLFQLLVKYDHKFALTSQWFGQFTMYLIDFSYSYPYSLLRILFAEINRIVTIRPLQILKGKSSRSLLHCISS